MPDKPAYHPPAKRPHEAALAGMSLPIIISFSPGGWSMRWQPASMRVVEAEATGESVLREALAFLAALSYICGRPSLNNRLMMRVRANNQIAGQVSRITGALPGFGEHLMMMT
jgi:hypothetical protein